MISWKIKKVVEREEFLAIFYFESELESQMIKNHLCFDFDFRVIFTPNEEKIVFTVPNYLFTKFLNQTEELWVLCR